MGPRDRPLKLLFPASEGARPGPALPRAVLPRLMARGDSSIFAGGPVGEGGRGPEATFLSFAAPFGVGLHRRRPQVGVVDVALRSIGGELTRRPRGAGRGLEERVLVQEIRIIEIRSPIRLKKKKKKN